MQSSYILMSDAIINGAICLLTIILNTSFSNISTIPVLWVSFAVRPVCHKFAIVGKSSKSTIVCELCGEFTIRRQGQEFAGGRWSFITTSVMLKPEVGL